MPHLAPRPIRRVAPRNDDRGCGPSVLIKHTSAFPRRVWPGLCKSFRPKKRGRRECRVLAAPAVSCAKCTKESAHEHTGTVGAFRHSPHNGFTAYAALSPATNSSCHRHRRIKVFRMPGWARKTSADLAPATGARTTRFCRTLQRRSSTRWPIVHKPKPALRSPRATTLPRPPHPIPTFVTMANAPLRDETAGFLPVIWGRWEEEYFRGKVWTGQITLNRLTKSPCARRL
jgi:hypothetical protein